MKIAAVERRITATEMPRRSQPVPFKQQMGVSFASMRGSREG
jgi:hypothetical protein